MATSAAGAPLERVTPARRLAALGIDLGLLLAAYLLVLFVGLSLTGSDMSEIALWVALIWALVIGPLYFALYHAFGAPDGGAGATPGQHELGICVQDADSHERISLRRALARSYGGVLAVVTVVPAFVDLAALVRSDDGRAWHDRVFGAEVSRTPSRVHAPASKPTSAGLIDLFAPQGRPGTHLYGRARRLVRSQRMIVRATLLVNVGLVLIAALLVPLIVADADIYGGIFWLGLALILFGSGVFWTQAVIVTAVEAARTGEIDVSAREVVRRASRRANALTAALVLLLSPYILMMVASASVAVLWGAPVLLPLLSLVVPAIVLEDRTVLGAFGRSWRLVTRRAGLAFLLFLTSVLLLLATIGVTLGVGVWIIDLVAPDWGPVAFSLAAALALLLACLPLSRVLAAVGSAWCLFYFDLCRHEAARSTGD